MDINSRLKELERLAHQHKAGQLFKELLGSTCLVGKLDGEPVRYRTKNGKIYSRQELTEVIRDLRQLGSIDSPILIVSEPKPALDDLLTDEANGQPTA
jgi:hypothetical protein